MMGLWVQAIGHIARVQRTSGPNGFGLALAGVFTRVLSAIHRHPRLQVEVRLKPLEVPRHLPPSRAVDHRLRPPPRRLPCPGSPGRPTRACACFRVSSLVFVPALALARPHSIRSTTTSPTHSRLPPPLSPHHPALEPPVTAQPRTGEAPVHRTSSHKLTPSLAIRITSFCDSCFIPILPISLRACPGLPQLVLSQNQKNGPLPVSTTIARALSLVSARVLHLVAGLGVL